MILSIWPKISFGCSSFVYTSLEVVCGAKWRVWAVFFVSEKKIGFFIQGSVEKMVWSWVLRGKTRNGKKSGFSGVTSKPNGGRRGEKIRHFFARTNPFDMPEKRYVTISCAFPNEKATNFWFYVVFRKSQKSGSMGRICPESWLFENCHKIKNSQFFR